MSSGIAFRPRCFFICSLLTECVNQSLLERDWSVRLGLKTDTTVDTSYTNAITYTFFI